MTSKVVVVGRLVLDTRFEVDHWPNDGETTFATNYQLQPGGKTINAAVAASRLGARTSIIGLLGNDLAGQIIREYLARENISVSDVIDVEYPTPLVNVILLNGQTTFIVGRGKVPPNFVQLANLLDKRPKLFDNNTCVLGNFGLGVDVLGEIFQLAKASNATTILNPAPSIQVRDPQFWQKVDYLIPNIDEARKLINEDWNNKVEDIAWKLLNLGPKLVCITLGEHGAYVRSKRDDGFYVSAHKVAVLDTTGASDAFCAAVATALGDQQMGVNLWAFASIAGALACAKVGSATSMPTKAEVMREIVR